MPHVETINLNDVSVYLMEINDFQLLRYISALTDTEKTRFNSIKNPKKKLEFAASRYLKHHLFGTEELFYDDSGTPYLEKSGYISITHSKKYVAIGRCDAFHIGIDLEEINQKAQLLHKKFINDEEATIFDSSSPKEMTLLWSFKETLYKLSDRKALIFKTDLIVSKKGNEYIGKTLTKNGFKETVLAFIEIDGFILTCNQTRLQKKHEHT